MWHGRWWHVWAGAVQCIGRWAVDDVRGIKTHRKVSPLLAVPFVWTMIASRRSELLEEIEGAVGKGMRDVGCGRKEGWRVRRQYQRSSKIGCRAKVSKPFAESANQMARPYYCGPNSLRHHLSSTCQPRANPPFTTSAHIKKTKGRQLHKLAVRGRNTRIHWEGADWTQASFIGQNATLPTGMACLMASAAVQRTDAFAKPLWLECNGPDSLPAAPSLCILD